MARCLPIAPPRNFDPIIIVFGARVEAALARQARERARRAAKLDAFLGAGNSPFLDARRDERGVYVVR
jgi:hypothetical protein